MKISWRMILGLSLGLTAWTGCGDSDADNPLDKHTSNLVQTWNSPDGETRVLAGDSPASIVDDTLTDEERAKVLRDAYPALLRGCYATSLRIESTTETYHFLRATQKDNDACETFVSIEPQHETDLHAVYRCDLENVDLSLEASANDGVPRWPSDVSFESTVLSSCEEVPNALHQLDADAPCATHANSWFVCSLVHVCTPYTQGNDASSMLGVCTDANSEDALEYALNAPKHHMVQTRGAGDWPYDVFDRLAYTADRETWTEFWRTIAAHNPAFYLTWNDEDTSVTLFKGWAESPPSALTALSSTLVSITEIGQEAVLWACDELPANAFEMNDEGQPNLNALRSAIESDCALASDGYPLAVDTVCSADADSPFQCTDDAECVSLGRGWLGACAIE